MTKYLLALGLILASLTATANQFAPVAEVGLKTLRLI